MKTWKFLTGVLFVLLGFCAGIAINFSSLNATAQGPPQPPPAALKSVTHNATLTGDGTTTAPLGIASGGVGTGQLANGAVTAMKINTAGLPAEGQVLGFDGSSLAWQAAPVGGVRVVDRDGQVVGPLVVGRVLRKIGGFNFLLSVGPVGFLSDETINFYHTTSDCSGPRYFYAGDESKSFSKSAAQRGTELLYVAEPSQQVTVRSYENVPFPPDPNRPVRCIPADQKIWTGLLTTFDLSTLGLVPPFHLEF